MGKTRTIFVDLLRLNRCDHAALIIKLMMACNDICLANQCLSSYKKNQPSIRKHVQLGAGKYFVNLQCGHVCEAMKIISKIKDDEQLLKIIGRCSELGQTSFKKLTDSLIGGSDYNKYEKLFLMVRNNLIFHYDQADKLIHRALIDRSNRREARFSTITFGDDLSLCRFELADDIIDSIVCRQFLKIPRNADLRKEVDEIMDYGSELANALLNFGSEFIGRYIRQHAAS